MTREETINILMTIQAAYPNYKPQDKTVAVNTWCEMLSEYTYQQISTALKAFIANDTSGFAPSIGQLIEKVRTIYNPAELSEMEAWGMVSKALRNSYYHADEEFAKLPQLVQKAVGSPGMLRNWAETDIEIIESVIQSNFMRTYRAELLKKQEISKMPTPIKNMIDESTVFSIPLPNVRYEPYKIGSGPIVPDGVPMPESAKQRLSQMLG